MEYNILRDANYDSDSKRNEILSAMTYGENVLALATDFGFEGYQSGNRYTRIQELQAFTNANWDFRGGKERWESGAPEFSQDQCDEIFGRSRDIAGYNLVDSTQLDEPVAAVSVLGGGNDAAVHRLRYAKENTQRLGITPDVYLLGSAREVTDAERAKTDVFAPGAQTEFDLMNSAAEIVYEIELPIAEQVTSEDNDSPEMMLQDVLGILGDPEGFAEKRKQKVQQPDYWAIRSYDMTSYKIWSLLAPQVEGNRRANTADSMAFMCRTFARALIEKKITAVTHAHYTAFQDIDLLRMVGLRLGAQTSTIGFSADYAGIERQPHQLLQEINSAVNSAVALSKVPTED